MKRIIPFLTVICLLVTAFSAPFSIGVAEAKAPATSEEPTSTPTPAAGGSGSQTINPLTGLPVDDPDCLKNSPALISITNFPASARPQAGLDYSNVVVEAYVGEGMTRFLAIFYCDYPQNPNEISNQPGASDPASDKKIGPIRSGRIWYEDVRKLYSGFLVMASAWKGVAVHLSQYANVFGSDDNNINSAMVDITKLDELSKATAQKFGTFDLSGNVFDANPPADGVTGESVWFRYSLLNQVMWRYDPTTGAYNRYNNDTQEGTKFEIATDRLNGSPLSYENVIVMFADHHAKADTLINIDYIGVKRPALLFRDGKMYKIEWNTMNGDYEKSTGKLRPPRFTDQEGNPIALKPGQTWIMVVPTYSPYYETVDSWNIIDMLNKKEPGSGHWAVVFYTPKIEE